MSKADSAFDSNAPSSSTLLVSFTMALFWMRFAGITRNATSTSKPIRTKQQQQQQQQIGS